MNALDWLLVLVAGLTVLAGLLKGLTRVLINIAALIAAFVLAAHFHERLADIYAGWMSWPEATLKLLGYLSIFAATLLAGGLVAFLVRKLVKAAALGWADRLTGAAVGLVAALLGAALVLLPAAAYVPAGQGLLRGSTLAPYVVVVADLASHLVPERLAERYRTQMEPVRQHWRDTGAQAI